jgi:hypothetical protein
MVFGTIGWGFESLRAYLIALHVVAPSRTFYRKPAVRRILVEISIRWRHRRRVHFIANKNSGTARSDTARHVPVGIGPLQDFVSGRRCMARACAARVNARSLENYGRSVSR